MTTYRQHIGQECQKHRLSMESTVNLGIDSCVHVGAQIPHSRRDVSRFSTRQDAMLGCGKCLQICTLHNIIVDLYVPALQQPTPHKILATSADRHHKQYISPEIDPQDRHHCHAAVSRVLLQAGITAAPPVDRPAAACAPQCCCWTGPEQLGPGSPWDLLPG